MNHEKRFLMVFSLWALSMMPYSHAKDSIYSTSASDKDSDQELADTIAYTLVVGLLQKGKDIDSCINQALAEIEEVKNGGLKPLIPKLKNIFTDPEIRSFIIYVIQNEKLAVSKKEIVPPPL